MHSGRETARVPVENSVTQPPGAEAATTATPWVGEAELYGAAPPSRGGGVVVAALLAVLVVAAWVWMPPPPKQEARGVSEQSASPRVIVGDHAAAEGESESEAMAVGGGDAVEIVAEARVSVVVEDVGSAAVEAAAERLCASSLRRALHESEYAVMKCLVGHGVMIEAGVSVWVSVSVASSGEASVEVTRLALPRGAELGVVVRRRVKACVVDALAGVGSGCRAAASGSKKYDFK